MASVGKKAREEMKGKEREMGSERKKARVEMKGKERVLFIEIDGDLLGIDVNKYDYSNMQYESLPELAPICCRVELKKHKYPLGMRYMKVNDKLYLLGGHCFDLLDPNSNSLPPYLGCSDKVYELNLHTLTTQINDKDQPLVLHPDHVLKPVSPLLKPMSPFVANLRGRYYVLYYRVPTVIFEKPKDPDFTFEEFDPTNESWLPAPTPPLDVSKDEMSWLNDMIPPSSLLVVDDKLLLFSRKQDYVHVYIGGGNEWKSYPNQSISMSFNDDVPHTGIWLSNFSFDDDPHLGVMLSIQLVTTQGNCYGIDIPVVCRYNAEDGFFHETYKVFAYAIHKSTCHVTFCQQLDEVFSDMIRTPLHGGKVTHFLLDLGESEHNNKRSSSSRRICAILTSDDLINRVPYLYISIFELQMTQVPSSTFLHVTPVKKLIFRLDKDKHPLAHIIEIPPLDAFFI